MESRWGWRVQELILLLLILFQALDFLELLSPFWDYIKKVVSWALILSLLYQASPSNIFFGIRVKWWDAVALGSLFLLSFKNVVSFAAATTATMLEDVFSYVRFVPAEAMTGNLTIPLSEGALNTFLYVQPILPNATSYAKAFATQLSLGVNSIPFTLTTGEQTAGAALQPYGLDGTVLQLYNSLLLNGAAIERFTFLLGTLLLLALGIYASLRLPVRKPSVLAVLHEDRRSIGRTGATVLVMAAYFVLLFNFVVEWLAIAIDAPIAMTAIAVYLYAHHKAKRDEGFLRGVGNFGSRFLKGFGTLFTSWRTLPLGLSGLLVLHLLADAGVFLVPYGLGLTDALYFSQLGPGHEPLYHHVLEAWTANAGTNAALLVVALLNLLGALFLLCLPAYMWYKAYRIRTRDISEPEEKHHPRLAEWLVALGLTSIAAFLLMPAFRLSRLHDLGLVGVDIQTRALEAVSPWLLVALAAFFVVTLIGGARERPRQYLMAGLFLAGAAFLAWYAYAYFMSSVGYYLNEIPFLLQQGGAWLLIGLVLLVLAAINLAFYVFGLIAFGYELGRD